MKQTRGEGGPSALAQLAERRGGVITAEEYQAALRLAGAAYDNLRPDETDVGGVPRRPRDQRERRLQSSIVKLARLYGWACYHVYDSTSTVPGFPDLELSRVHPLPRIIKAELKDETNKPTEDQVEWLNLYAAMGGLVEVYLWRPQHLDAIAEILKPEWKLKDDADPGVFGLWALGTEPVEVRKLSTKARGAARPKARLANRARL